MANSRYDYHKEDEKNTDLKFNRGTYIIVRIDGEKFHQFSDTHNFHKPNDKRALDLMIESAKQVMRTYKGHIPLAYGHSDEFSFLIKSTSNMLSRRLFKITSVLASIFTAAYNSNWDKFFKNPLLGEITDKTCSAHFDARPKEYPNYRAVIDYFRWRQVDCHINNLYNTSLHALTGRYINYKLDGSRQPITEWIQDKSSFLSSRDATEKLSGTVSSEKHDLLYLQCKINYNNELEQFKKGSVIVDTQDNFNGKNPNLDAIKVFHLDLIKGTEFWDQNRQIFEDYVSCPPTK